VKARTRLGIVAARAEQFGIALHEIRGFGPLKAAAIERYERRLAALEDRFR
jgi:hypothetical protein